MQLGVCVSLTVSGRVSVDGNVRASDCPATACPQPLPFPDFVLAVQS